jgi:hypothetical protein
MNNLNEIKKEATNNNNNNSNNNFKEVEVMERREEIKTEIEELMEQIKEEENELTYFNDSLIYKDYKADKIYRSYENDDIYDIITEWANDYFIYDSYADEFLEDYDIYECIKEIHEEFGIMPESPCQLANFIIEREAIDNDYNIIKDIQDKLKEIEELQEELAELEAEAEEVER